MLVVVQTKTPTQGRFAPLNGPPSWIAEQSPYRYAVWLTNLNPVHVVFDAPEIVALGTASDEEWFSVFSRKLRAVLAEEAL